MKRVITLTLGVALTLAFASSCVSKSKYVAAQQNVDRLQKDSTQCENSVRELKTNLQRTQTQFSKYKNKSEDDKASLMAQLQKQGSELNEKDQALQLRAQRLRALQDRLQRQQEIVTSLRTTVEDALVNIKGEDLSVEVKNGKVYVSLSDKLLFPSGSADLNKGGMDAIGKLGTVLKNNPQINIDVVGHTDSLRINTAKYRNNWELSTARATTITKLLTDKYGVAGARLTASGASKYNPIASNETKEGRAKNRRTEIILTPKLQELFKILDGPTTVE
jgi:chemotaxis protein MotB